MSLGGEYIGLYQFYVSIFDISRRCVSYFLQRWNCHYVLSPFVLFNKTYYKKKRREFRTACISGPFYFLFSASSFSTSIHSSKSHKLCLIQKLNFPYSVSRTAIFRRITTGRFPLPNLIIKNDLPLVSLQRIQATASF